MARDVQISLGQASVPAEYVVPNATEIVPKAVTARFNGAAAAGNFLPVVEIVSDGGVVVARAPCATTVVAGDSADVSFYPFDEGDGGAGGAALTVTDGGTTVAPTTTLKFASGASVVNAGNAEADVFIVGTGYSTIEDEGVGLTQYTTMNFVGAGVTASDDAPNSRTLITIPGGGSYTPPTSREVFSWASAAIGAGASGDANWTHQSGATLLSYANPARPKVLTAGIYAIGINGGTAEAVSVGRQTNVTLVVNVFAGGLLEFNVDGIGATGGFNPAFAACIVAYLTTSDTLEIFCNNSDTVAHTFQDTNAYSYVQRIT